MSVIKELYNGNILGFDSRQYASDSPYMSHVRRRQENRDKLMALLSDECKELFEAYEEAASDVAGIANFDTYAYTLRFAIILMAEVFTGQSESGDE